VFEKVKEKWRVNAYRSLEGRRIILPDPDALIKGWEDGVFSYPELSQINEEKYWDEIELSSLYNLAAFRYKYCL